MAKLQISLKARALRYLSAREHSRLELARKLARYAQEGDDIETLLDTLEAAKLLSQARFSESLIHRRAHRFGNSRILSELQSHGIDAEALVDIKPKPYIPPKPDYPAAVCAFRARFAALFARRFSLRILRS